MDMKKEHIKLSEADRQKLELIIKKGEQKAKVYKRAVGLLELDRGKTFTAVAETVGVNSSTVTKWRNKYRQVGLACLEDAPCSGRPIVFSGTERAKVMALVCSPAPEGYAK